VGRPRGDTREKLVRAAFESLRSRGYAGTSSRGIGEIAGVNSALVFYYFESVDDLLVEALATSSTARLASYRAASESASTLGELVSLLGAHYAEDVNSGHVRVVAELVSASVSRPELGVRVTALMDPWLELAEVTITRALERNPLREAAPASELALAVITFYLGANLLTDLMPERAQLTRLLQRGQELATLVDALSASDI
jgi:AcrR family transcriptional regulator